MLAALLTLTSSGGSLCQVLLCEVIFFVLSESWKLLGVLINGSRRLVQLFWLYFCNGSEGKKKRSAGQNMHVHTLLLLLLQFKLLKPCKREKFRSKYEPYLF